MIFYALKLKFSPGLLSRISDSQNHLQERSSLSISVNICYLNYKIVPPILAQQFKVCITGWKRMKSIDFFFHAQVYVLSSILKYISPCKWKMYWSTVDGFPFLVLPGFDRAEQITWGLGWFCGILQNHELVWQRLRYYFEVPKNFPFENGNLYYFAQLSGLSVN